MTIDPLAKDAASKITPDMTEEQIAQLIEDVVVVPLTMKYERLRAEVTRDDAVKGIQQETTRIINSILEGPEHPDPETAQVLAQVIEENYADWISGPDESRMTAIFVYQDAMDVFRYLQEICSVPVQLRVAGKEYLPKEDGEDSVAEHVSKSFEGEHVVVVDASNDEPHSQYAWSQFSEGFMVLQGGHLHVEKSRYGDADPLAELLRGRFTRKFPTDAKELADMIFEDDDA